MEAKDETFIQTDCPFCGHVNVHLIRGGWRDGPETKAKGRCDRCRLMFAAAPAFPAPEAVGYRCPKCETVTTEARQVPHPCACGSRDRLTYGLL